MCSGYDGFELALRLAGIDARTVAHVERDAYAAATLVARMEDAALDRAPIWSDLNTFDARPFAGRVDLVTAGLPCQPFSGAGQQRGLDDGRHLWPMAERIIADLGPRFVLLENVPDVVLPKYRWLEHVLGSLAALGFDAEWGVLSAADVGAPHTRERFWLLAYTEGVGHHPGDLRGRAQPSIADAPSRRVRMGDPDLHRCEGVGQRLGEDRSGGVVGRDADRPDVSDAWPPTRDDVAGWARWSSRGGPQPSIRRSTDGRPPGLADALHLGGNGLVPGVAALATLKLARRAGVALTERTD